MNDLALTAPGLTEATAVHLFDRAAALRSSPEWTARHYTRGLGDLAAWGLLLFLVLTFATIFVCVRAMRLKPRTARPEHDLIDEVLQNEDAYAASDPAAGSSAQPWEKPADWWKTGN